MFMFNALVYFDLYFLSCVSTSTSEVEGAKPVDHKAAQPGVQRGGEETGAQ